MKRKRMLIFAAVAAVVVMIACPKLAALIIPAAVVGGLLCISRKKAKEEEVLAAQQEAARKAEAEAAEEARRIEEAKKEAALELERKKEQESVVKKYEVSGVFYYLKNLLPMMEPNYLWDYKKQDLIDTCNTDVPIYQTALAAERMNLVHEEDNPHDPNAVMVLFDDKIVGYIAKEDCPHILEIMDNGLFVCATPEVRGGKWKMVCEEYDWEKDKSTYSMERGEDEYGITLYIREKVPQ